MGHIDRDLLIAGPLGLSRPTYGAIPHLPMPMHCCICAARWRAHVARRYDTKDTPMDINACTRATARTSHRRLGRTTARACVVARPPARPPVRPSARPPARPPVRPSARVWGGEGGWDLAGIVAAITAVVPVVADNPAGAVIEPDDGIIECGVWWRSIIVV